MHSKDALAAGETPQRLLLLSAWEESPFYSDRERAALRLTEAVTLLADGGVPDDVLDECDEAFSAEELAALLYAIVEINAWNRLAVTARAPVGDDEPIPST